MYGMVCVKKKLYVSTIVLRQHEKNSGTSLLPWSKCFKTTHPQSLLDGRFLQLSLVLRALFYLWCNIRWLCEHILL